MGKFIDEVLSVPPGAYIQSADPAIANPSWLQPKILWLDTSASPYVLKKRNADNDDWDTLGKLRTDAEFNTDVDGRITAANLATDAELAAEVATLEAADAALDTRVDALGVAKLVFEFGDGKNSTSLEADQTARFPDLPAGTITKVRIEGDAAGSAVVDIQTSTADPPSYSSICASAKPTLSSDEFAEDATLTGWTTTITEGTKARAVLESVSGMAQVTVVLTIQKA